MDNLCFKKSYCIYTLSYFHKKLQFVVLFQAFGGRKVRIDLAGESQGGMNKFIVNLRLAFISLHLKHQLVLCQ
jgi:hypothetical protein